MKRLFLGLTLLVACFVFAGCSSVPQFANMTGQWKYQFNEEGKKNIETGSMTLKQTEFALTGKANDAYGEFTLTGNIEGAHVIINGVRNDQKRSFKFSVMMQDENSFDGNYTTDQKTSGDIWGSRVISQ